MNRDRWIKWLGWFIGLLLLVGCSQESEIAIYPEQQWKFESSFTFDPESIPEVGIGAPLIPGLSVDASTSVFNPALVELSLNHMVNLYRQQGYNLVWEKKRSGTGELTYTLTAEGQGWEQLEGFLSVSGIANSAAPLIPVEMTEVGNGQVHFQATLPADLMGVNYLIPTTMRLRGGEIVSSNANEVQGGVATWYSPTGTLKATLTPVSPWSQTTLLAAGGLGLVLVLGGGGYFLLRQVGVTGRRPGPRIASGRSSASGRSPWPPRPSR